MAKPVDISQTTDSRNDLEGMELGAEGDLNEELGLEEDDMDGGDDEDGEAVEIKQDTSELIAARYRKEGQPDFFNFNTKPLKSLADSSTTTTFNDWYLHNFEPIPMFGASIKALDKRFDGYQKVSAFNKKEHIYTDFTETFRPYHGTTEGGKGLALYPNPTIMHTADMSSILNISTSFGCSSNCSFCKESLLARGFTETDFEEGTGIIAVQDEDGETFEIASKARVKFYDTNNETVVIGSIGTAIAQGFPISKDSIGKLKRGEMFRALSD